MEVYFAYNKVNGKAYVGWTQRTAKERFKKHCYQAGKGSHYHFHNAIRKYGPESFNVITVYRGDDIDEMKQVEKNYIAGMRTTDRHRGYNMTAGGDGFVVGYVHSDEERKRSAYRLKELWKDDEFRSKHTDAMKELWKDPEFRNKQRDAAKQALIGTKASAEHRANLSKAKIGYKLSPEGLEKYRTSRKGKCLNTHNRWHVARNIVNPSCTLCQEKE